MKREWKKEEKNIYLPKEKPVLINIPKMKYFVVDGKGDPNNSPEFQDAMQALYSLSYGIRMMPKNGVTPEGYYEYTVYPLEGVWDIDDKTKGFSKMDKSNLVYSVMIRQPDFVDNALANDVLEKTKKKKDIKSLDKAKFQEIEDGLCVQMLHIGPYDDEPESFAKMEQFCIDNNLRRKSLTHREIYLSDPRKTDQSKLRTVLRIWVEKIDK
jgi:hypothetical protein